MNTPAFTTAQPTVAYATHTQAQPALYHLNDVTTHPTYSTLYKYEKAPKTVHSGSAEGARVAETHIPQKRQGFFGKVENIFHRGVEQIGFGQDTQSRWAMFGINEPLYAEFPAKMANGTSYNRGYCFISEGHVCFSSYTDAANKAIKVVIPLSSVVHVNQAQRVKSNGTSLVFAPITSATMRPNSLQLITRDNMLHQIFGIKNCDQAYNVIHSVMRSHGQAAPSVATPSAAPLL